MCRIIELALETVFSPGLFKAVGQSGPDIFKEPKTVASFVNKRARVVDSLKEIRCSLPIHNSQFTIYNFTIHKAQEEYYNAS